MSIEESIQAIDMAVMDIQRQFLFMSEKNNTIRQTKVIDEAVEGLDEWRVEHISQLRKVF